MICVGVVPIFMTALLPERNKSESSLRADQSDELPWWAKEGQLFAMKVLNKDEILKR